MEKKGPTRKNGNGGNPKPSGPPSSLGQRLKEISDRALASGTTTLSNEEILRRIAEARGASA